MIKHSKNQPCPCDPSKQYEDCCEPFHQGHATPNTAEQLMRSRYSAYVLQLNTYIKETWHSSNRPSLAHFTGQPIKWLGLTINKSWSNKLANEAFVEFTASYKINGKMQKMHEISRFILENNKWFYLEGKLS